MIGNYGIPGKELDEHGLFKHFESNRIQAEALLISDYSHKHSHWNAAQSLRSGCRSTTHWTVRSRFYRFSSHTHKISNTHTGTVSYERVTKKIRQQGSMLGKIIVNNEDVDCNINKENLVAKVSTKRSTYNPNGELHIVAVDCGESEYRALSCGGC